jgi:hypothetical protein
MRQAVEQRGRELLIAGKHGHPFGEGEIGGDDRRPPLVAVGEQIEEQLAAGPIEGHEAQLVDDQHVDTQESLLEPRELARVARFNQLTHQIGGAGEEHPALPLRRFHAERDRQMRLAGPNRAGEDQILGRGDPLAACQRVNLRRADALRGREIKCVQRLDLGKARLMEPLADHRLMAGGLLGAQDLVQIVFVRPMRVARLPRESFKCAGDAGQLEAACLHHDQIANQGAGRSRRLADQSG